MIRGVISVVSGYTGGTLANPTYDQVSSGTTGHAECLKITFDPTIVSYDDLLSVFFNTHNPTTLNRQGNDIGTQYRSAIFYANDVQKHSAETLIAELNNSHAYDTPVVTEVQPLRAFYSAEQYHQQYYERYKDQPYCQLVIAPKLEKVRTSYARLLTL